MMAIVLTRGRSLISWLIKVQTRSEYSHAALWFSDKTLIEATWPKVKKTAEYRPGLREDVFMLDMTEHQEWTIRNFAEAQVGKPYDLTMVIRFVTRQQETRKSKGKWFCSELAFAAVGKVKNLLERIEPWAVSPEILSLSPFLYRLSD